MTGNRRVRFIPQDRDRHVLSELGPMRVVDREQAEIIGNFHSVRRANDRLLGMTRAGLLKRIFIPNPKIGQKALYSLSAKGAALVGARLPGLLLRQTAFGASPFLLHRLAINEIYIALKYRDLPKPDMRLSCWVSFREPLSQAIPLTPDGYFELVVDGNTKATFLEVDLGTEALPVWIRKTQLYLQMALSGNFTQWFGQSQFRVLVIATTDRRLQNIRTAIAKQTDKIFWLTTFEEINQRGFWSQIWLRPAGDQKSALT